MFQLDKKHQKYEKYNPTNIDWIGDIPDGWEVRRMKTLIKEHSGGVWGDEPLGNESDIACVRVADFNPSV